MRVAAAEAIAVNTPAMTAKAQPLAITIQPAPSAFERLSKTFATTPSPSNIERTDKLSNAFGQRLDSFP